MRKIEQKILDWPAMKAAREVLRKAGKKLVFTNGCFDLIHDGHVTYLQWARDQGDALVVALNSDASVRRLKGEKRPIVSQDRRARVMAALEMVDYVVFFDENEPANLISELLPDVLVKATDWAHYISGRDVVEKNGGRVALAPMVEGLSTTDLIRKIVQAYGDGKTT